MINELSLLPFNKLNCMGMLNTLLPPQPASGGKLPSPLLTSQKLRQERDTFFHYITQVQKHGPGVLENLTQGESTNWQAVQTQVDKYLRVAKNIIDESMATMGTEDFKSVAEPRKGKKTDSGVSFGSDLRPSTSSSIHERPVSESSNDGHSTLKGLSKLEKLSREFKRMRIKTRPDVEEMIKMDQDVPAVEDCKSKKIKKARSLANLRGRNHSSSSVAGSRKGSDAVPFNAEEMKRARAAYDSRNA